MDDYPFIYKTQIKWGEMDSLQHLNNIIYFRFFEEARIQIFKDLEISDSPSDTIGPILAFIDCQFKQPVIYPDEFIVASWIPNVGRTSITVMHRAFSQKTGAIVAQSKSVIVIVNYETGEKKTVPQNLREALLDLPMDF